MNVINIIDENRFSLNGIVFFKNFMSDVFEDKLRVFNVYDTRFQLIPFTSFDEFTVDGVTFVNVEDLQTTLATLLYARNLNGSGGTPSTGEKDGLIIGTSEHIGNYQYRFIAQQYRINGTLYNTVLNTVITFDPADPDDDRIDLVIIQLVGGIPQIAVIKGVPADPASKPILQNIETQIEFTIITVKAATTEPIDITSLLVYDEFAQEVGGEFNCTTASDFIFPLDETDPYEGVRDIWFNGTPENDNITFSHSTVFNTAGRNLILKFKQRVVHNYRFEIDLGGSPIMIQGNAYGLDPYSTSYQSLIIPLGDFAESTFQTVRITNKRNAADFFIDKIELQSGGSVPLEGYTLRGGYNGTTQQLKDLIDAIDNKPATELDNFNGQLSLANKNGTTYNNYNLSGGTISFTPPVSSTLFGFDYLILNSDGVTEIAIENNLNEVFNFQYGIPSDRILPIGLFEVFFLKTPTGISISIPGYAAALPPEPSDAKPAKMTLSSIEITNPSDEFKPNKMNINEITLS